MSTVLRCLALLLVAAAPLVAQRAPTARIPEGQRICDMSARIVAVRLVDRAGAPISDASIRVRRIRTRSLLERAESMGESGDYRIVEDGDLRDLRPAGEPFDVTFRKGTRSRTVRLLLGSDPAGCHVALLRGPTTIRL